MSRRLSSGRMVLAVRGRVASATRSAAYVASAHAWACWRVQLISAEKIMPEDRQPSILAFPSK